MLNSSSINKVSITGAIEQMHEPDRSGHWIIHCLPKPIPDGSRANIGALWLILHQVIENMQKYFLVTILAMASPMLHSAESVEEVVSFRCGLAIDAAIAEMDKQSGNLVTQEALSKINDENGEFVCVQTEASKLFVRLQSKEMSATESRLIFTVDPQTYRVTKTYYGR